MSYMKQFGITVLVFFTIDILWLAVVAKNMYRKYIGHLMAEKFMMSAAFLFYIVYIIGLLYFVINPAILKGSFKYALLSGMFYGFITYATYDLTNLATLKDWPIAITLIDIGWGTLLCGLTSVLTYLLLKH